MASFLRPRLALIGAPRAGPVAVDDLDAGVAHEEGLVNGLLDLATGRFPVLPGVDDVHFKKAHEGLAADRGVALGAAFVPARLRGDPTGGARGGGISGTHGKAS